MAENKLPFWKQLLGAIAGATIAIVLHQGYTLASSHFQVMNQALRFDSLQAAVWTTKILTNDRIRRRASSSSFDRQFVARPSSHVATTVAASSYGPEAPYETNKDELTREPQILESHTAAISKESTHADTGPPIVAITGNEPLQDAVDPIVADVSEHGWRLPQSGFGLDLLAFMALGAVIGRKKAKRK